MRTFNKGLKTGVLIVCPTQNRVSKQMGYRHGWCPTHGALTNSIQHVTLVISLCKEVSAVRASTVETVFTCVRHQTVDASLWESSIVNFQHGGSCHLVDQVSFVYFNFFFLMSPKVKECLQRGDIFSSCVVKWSHLHSYFELQKWSMEK